MEQVRTKFVICTMPRSGSHMLRTALHNHSKMRCHGEEFNVVAGHNSDLTKEQVFEKVYGINPEAEASGFIHHLHMFSFQRPKHPWATLQDDLVNIPDLKVIHLYRFNLLKQYVSNSIANNTKIWHRLHESHDHPDKVVNIRPDKLLMNFKMTLRLNKKALDDFKNHEYITVMHEKFVTKYEEEIERVQKFLDADVETIQPITLKQEVRPLTEIISNYDEVENVLRGTRYEIFLDGDQNG